VALAVFIWRRDRRSLRAASLRTLLRLAGVRRLSAVSGWRSGLTSQFYFANAFVFDAIFGATVARASFRTM
jgi:hypothetical protein